MSDSVECEAHRLGGSWVGHVAAHGVYGNGRTLKAMRDSIQDGLAHIGVTTQVTVVAVTPELATLRSAEDTYTAALRAAVQTLAQGSATLGDIATATGVPATRVKELLADRQQAALPMKPP